MHHASRCAAGAAGAPAPTGLLARASIALASLPLLAAAAADPAPADQCPTFVPESQPHLTLARQGFGPAQEAAAAARAGLPAAWVVQDEFVVQFRAEAADVIRQSAALDAAITGFGPVDDTLASLAAQGLRPMYPGADRAADQARGLPDMTGWYVVHIDTDRIDLAGAMEAMWASDFVTQVEPIGVHALCGVPNDGYFANQWFLSQTSDKDIDAPEGWDVENGSPSIAVAVLDTGVRYFHKDLGGVNTSYSTPGATDGNVWRNMAEFNGVAGVDDDGNGYVDDWIGYDFVSSAIYTCWSGEDCTTADADPRDFNGHGTHCAGIVTAMNNNGYAVASAGGGFGPGTNTATGDGVKVMCLRIGHSANYGGQEAGFVRMDYAASAFYYAAAKGAKVASCSWGSSNSGGIAAALDYFIAAGGLVFKAAGNDGTQTADYMCGRSDVYSVVATDASDKKASFSTYGTWADISAPGVGIYSTYHNHAAPSSDYVASLDGTSMATPLVASVAGVVWSKNPSWTRTQVWDAVRLNTDNIDSLNAAYVGKMGSGRVNLNKALGGSAPPPPSGQKYLLVLSGSPSLPGVGTVGPEDVVQYDSGTGQWSLYFDGSDVGLSGFSIDAFTVRATGELIISTTASGSLAGLQGGPSGTTFAAQDLLMFIPTSLGGTTTGTWAFYFDGSDVGLTTTGENIDAVAFHPDGRILISTSGNPSVSGLSGLGDEDIIGFTATSLGSVTAGTWSYWFDGSDVAVSTNSENVDAAWVSAGGLLTFSTSGAYSVSGVSGDGRDLVRFTPTSTGTNTAGTFSLRMSGAGAGIPSGANVVAVVELP